MTTTKLTPLQRALLYLKQLIEAGVEYPDAHYRASTKFGVSSEALQSLYDEEE